MNDNHSPAGRTRCLLARLPQSLRHLIPFEYIKDESICQRAPTRYARSSSQGGREEAAFRPSEFRIAVSLPRDENGQDLFGNVGIVVRSGEACRARTLREDGHVGPGVGEGGTTRSPPCGSECAWPSPRAARRGHSGADSPCPSSAAPWPAYSARRPSAARPDLPPRGRAKAPSVRPPRPSSPSLPTLRARWGRGSADQRIPRAAAPCARTSAPSPCGSARASRRRTRRTPSAPRAPGRASPPRAPRRRACRPFRDRRERRSACRSGGRGRRRAASFTAASKASTSRMAAAASLR